MRHLLLCLLAIVSILAPGVYARAADDADRAPEPPAQAYRWKFSRIAREVVDARTFDAAAAQVRVQEACATAGDDAAGAAKAVFDTYSFAEVEALAKAGKISAEHSQLLARGRRELMRRTFEAVLAEVAPNGEFRIGAMDSGNKLSGIASDIDQTVFLIQEGGTTLSPAEQSEAIKNVIEAIDRHFTTISGGKSPLHFGIESMNGADFYPDWMSFQHPAEFATEADRVWALKSDNPEAYRSEGELMIQALKRGIDSLEEFRPLAQQLESLGAELERERAKPAPDAAIVGKLEADLAALREKCERLSPWLEVRKTENGFVATFTAVPDAPIPNSVEVVSRYAVDGAWDNWIMFEEHAGNRAKYLLRSCAEGVGLVYQEKQGAKVLVPFDYDAVLGKELTDPQAQAANRTQQFIDQIYGDLPDAKRRQIRRALDCAALARLKHKGLEIGGQPITQADVFKRYVAYVSESIQVERLMTEDKVIAMYGSKQAYDAAMLDAGQRLWAGEAREIMIENLIRTAQATGTAVDVTVAAEEAKRVGREGGAEVLREAVRKQFIHGFHDIMSPEHVQALTAATPEERAKLDAARTKDVVDRIIEKAPPELRPHLQEYAAFAAAKRRLLQIEADEHRTGPMYDYVKGLLATFTRANFKKEWAGVQERYAKGEYAPEKIAGRMLESLQERAWGTASELAGALGIVGDLRTIEPAKVGELPSYQLENVEWHPQEAVRNMLSTGNLDAALRVVRVAQGGASGFEVAKAAAGEAFFMLPGVAHVDALKNLLTGADWHGAHMLGTAMLIPGAGEVYILYSIGSSVVWIAHDFVITPLSDDIADKAYQGFLGTENSKKFDERSQRAGLLEHVPIRVVPYRIGNRAMVAVGPYPDDEAIQYGLVESPEQAREMRAAGLLGGGPEWEEWFPKANDWLAEPRLNFEAKRASMFYYFAPRAERYCQSQGVEPEWDRQTVIEPLIGMFLITIDQWLKGTGEFGGGATDAEVQDLIAEWFTPEMRRKLALRMASDFVQSFRLLRGPRAVSVPDLDPADPRTMTVEVNIKRAVRRRVEEQTRLDTNAALFATEDAIAASTDPGDLDAAERVLRERMENGARLPNARVRVWPMVVTDGNGETVRAGVSVVAPPADFPPPYKLVREWRLAGPERKTAFLRISAFDAGGKQVGESVEREIGDLAAPPEVTNETGVYQLVNTIVKPFGELSAENAAVRTCGLEPKTNTATLNEHPPRDGYGYLPASWHGTLTWSAPPGTLTPGQPFTMTITTSGAITTPGDAGADANGFLYANIAGPEHPSGPPLQITQVNTPWGPPGGTPDTGTAVQLHASTRDGRNEQYFLAGINSTYSISLPSGYDDYQAAVNVTVTGDNVCNGQVQYVYERR